MDTQPTYSEDARLNALHDAIAAHGHTGTQLPSLTIDTSWVKEALKKVWEIVEPWLPEFSIKAGDFPFPVDPGSLWFWAKILLVITALFLAYKALQLLLGMRNPSSPFLSVPSQIPVGGYSDLLQNATREGRWKEALRLRWCILLKHRNFASSLTPIEFVARGGSLSPLSSFLAGMFGAQEHANEDLYLSFSRQCEQLEGPSAQKGMP